MNIRHTPFGPPLPARLMGDDEELPGCLEQHIAYLRQKGLSETTIVNRIYIVTRLRDEVGFNLFQATDRDLCEWRAGLDLSTESINNYVWHVRSFYEWARIARKVRKNPAAGIPVPRRGRRLPRPIGDPALLEALAAADYPVRQMLVLAGWAGLRAKEIALLRRQNVLDRQRPPVLLIATDATKGRRERTIPMSEFVLAELLPVLPAAGYVFRRADGQPGPNRPGRVSQLCNDHLHDSGVPESLHQLRHRFGTGTYQGSKDLRLVQELMGHASPVTTAGYAAYDNASAIVAVDALPAPRRLRKVNAS